VDAQERYTFRHENEKLTGRLVILTGVARSGTTILGKLIASLKGVEFEYEPWLLAQLPIAQRAGLIEPSLAEEMLRAYLGDLFNCHILGRSVNTRPADDSSILNFLSEEELNARWHNIKDRNDAWKYIEEHKSIFAVKMVNLLPFYEFLYRALPGVKIINIVRNGLDTALSIQKKGWFADEALEKGESLSMKKEVWIDYLGKKRLLPWWVGKDDAERFIGYSEFARGLCCWRTMMEDGAAALKRCTAKPGGNYLEVRYESLVDNPAKTMQDISSFISAPFGTKTEYIIKTVDRDRAAAKRDYPLSDADKYELDKVSRIMKELGYEI